MVQFHVVLTGFRFFADDLVFSGRVLMPPERPHDLRVIPFDNTVINQIKHCCGVFRRCGSR